MAYYLLLLQFQLQFQLWLLLLLWSLFPIMRNIRAHNWKLWPGVWRRMVFQTERFFTQTNERHNLIRKDHRIYKWEHQKYWNNFEKLNRKPAIFNHWQNIENKCRATKRQLQQRKLKTFIFLKYKPQPINEQTPAIIQTNFKKSYAYADKRNTNIVDPKVQHLRNTSKTNTQEEQPTLLKKLELLHRAHAQHRRGKLPRVP